MKAFNLPRWQQRQVAAKNKRKTIVVNKFIAAMERVMHAAIDKVVDESLTRREFVEPSLNEMFAVSESFYRGVIEQAYHASEDEKRAQTKDPNFKHLSAASRAPIGLPRTLRQLEKVFRDRRYWPKIMKRSKAVTEGLRTQYLRKLRRKFRDLMPRIMDGDVTPEEAKKAMKTVWEASKGRVQTIFLTETTTYFAKTQTAFFKGDDQIIGFLFDSALKDTTTDICRSRHGLVYRPGTKLLDENTPSCHYNCHSDLIPLADTPFNRRLLADPRRDPEKRKVVPLPPGWRR